MTQQCLQCFKPMEGFVPARVTSPIYCPGCLRNAKSQLGSFPTGLQFVSEAAEPPTSYARKLFPAKKIAEMIFPPEAKEPATTVPDATKASRAPTSFVDEDGLVWDYGVARERDDILWWVNPRFMLARPALPTPRAFLLQGYASSWAVAENCALGILRAPFERLGGLPWYRGVALSPEGDLRLQVGPTDTIPEFTVWSRSLGAMKGLGNYKGQLPGLQCYWEVRIKDGDLVDYGHAVSQRSAVIACLAVMHHRKGTVP